MQKDSTRLKILDFLQLNQSATPGELARAMNITASAVRYHLARLEREGQIESVAITTQIGPGRPAQAFRLTEHVRPNFFAGLSAALLKILLTHTSPEEASRCWTDLARQIAGPGPDSTQPSRRLAFTIRELNRMNYQARWEAGPLGPRIRLFNCPYAAIWPQFNSLCQMDRHLLERWTGRLLRQTARIDFSGHRPSSCVFESSSGPHNPTLQLA